MRETKDLEFKGSISNTFLKTVSAFANFNGGKILFGIADDGTVKGIDNPQECYLEIENKSDYQLNDCQLDEFYLIDKAIMVAFQRL